MADDQVADAPQNDGTVDFAANAIADLLKAQSAPEPAPVETQNSPQAAEQPQADPVETPAEDAQAPADDNTAPQADPVPAVLAPSISPEIETAKAEAAKIKQEAEAARNQFVNALNTLVPQMESAIRGEFADIKNFDDLQNVAQTDPDRYNRYVIAQARLQQAQQAQAQAQAQEREAQAQRLNEWRASEQQKLIKAIPELTDPDKGPALARKIQDFAMKSGYTAQQLSNASANDFAILHKAMQVENLQAQLKAAQAKAANAPPVQKPGVKPATTGKDEKISTDFQRLQKTGRVDDAAALFKNFLN